MNAASSFGLRRDDLIVKDGDMFAVEERLAEYERWRVEREQLVVQVRRPKPPGGDRNLLGGGSRGTRDRRCDCIGFGIEVVQMPGAEGRPRGARFGALVHAMLAIVPLDASEEMIRRTAEVQARIIGSPVEEAVAAAHAVRAVLQHELMVRARASTRLRRETAFPAAPR